MCTVNINLSYYYKMIDFLKKNYARFYGRCCFEVTLTQLTGFHSIKKEKEFSLQLFKWID